MPVGAPSADALYEKEIARLQGELGNVQAEHNRLSGENFKLIKESEELGKMITKQKNEIVALEKAQKKAEEDFKTSHQRSAEALRAQDVESAKRKEESVKLEDAAKESLRLANAARSQLVAIATDQKNTAAKIEKLAAELKASVTPELDRYIALASPKVEIPAETSSKKGK